MKNILNLVLTNFWFEQIKSGKKTHEYRVAKPYWTKRLGNKKYTYVRFQQAYRKNAPKIIFEIKNIDLLPSGKNTDLKIDVPVFDITLGNRIE
ncbi:MAG: hypothetical protein J6R99_03730 [Alphaproteobacteria bacterium]|nr:hypothetical protein [Alphaproteobacteria bacterium]